MALTDVGWVAQAVANVSSVYTTSVDWLKTRLNMRNTPEMRKADTAAKDQKQLDEERELLRRAAAGNKEAEQELERRES